MDIKEEKFLLFFLNEEYYGISILKVNEIIGLMSIIPIPKTPDFMKGVINLRGKIIPVMDLRLKFTLPEKEYDEQTCIIIVEIPYQKELHFVGLLVDKVAEVVNIYNTDIELPPEYGQTRENGFLTGIGKVKGNVVMLLDIESIINSNDIINLIKQSDEVLKSTEEEEEEEENKKKNKESNKTKNKK